MTRNHELFHLVHQLSRKLTKRLNETLQPLGLYSAQWAVIFVLKEKGPLTQKELCEYLSVEAPPMTRTIKRLANQGYISQVPGEDKRSKIISLTAEALAKYPKWEASVLETNETLLMGYSESSRQELVRLLSIWIKKV